LGNQLFSYYCAIYSANRIGLPITLDFSSVDKSHFSSSIPLLSADLPKQLILLNTSPNVNFEPNRFFNVRKRQIQRRLGFRRSHLFELGHDSISEVTEYLDLSRNRNRSQTIIEGYFGDFGFYDSVEPQFQKLQLRKVSPFYLEMVAKMGNYNYCSVHHRLGDFLELANSVGLLGKKYYQESFEIAEKSGCERFLIFSNDPTKSKEIFQNWGFDLSNMTWVDSILLSSPFENLLLMGEAKGLITSNSTFSFWGGKFAHKRCRTIVYPKVFRKDNFTEILNIPSDWVPIDSHWQQD
jgi:hypothetical protein